MIKKKLWKVGEAQDLVFYTDILSNLPEAANMKDISTADVMSRRVFLVKDKQDNILCVLKTMSFKLSATEEISLAQNEYSIPYKLGSKHQNIAKGLFFKEKEFTSDDCHVVEMLMEYGGEDLLTLARHEKLTGNDIISIAKQTASAMEYAHRQGIFHSDLKPQNITLKNGLAKIIDFGVSMDLGKQENVKHFTVLQTGKVTGITRAYAPPEICYQDQLKALGKEGELEVLKRVVEASREKIDVYMWGMTFYHIISKKTLESLGEEWRVYRGSSEAYTKFKEGLMKLSVVGVNPGLSRSFIKLIYQCLAYGSVDRPSFDNIQEEISYMVTSEERPALIIPAAAPAEQSMDLRKAETVNEELKGTPEMKAGIIKRLVTTNEDIRPDSSAKKATEVKKIEAKKEFKKPENKKNMKSIVDARRESANLDLKKVEKLAAANRAPDLTAQTPTASGIMLLPPKAHENKRPVTPRNGMGKLEAPKRDDKRVSTPRGERAKEEKTAESPLKGAGSQAEAKKEERPMTAGGILSATTNVVKNQYYKLIKGSQDKLVFLGIDLLLANNIRFQEMWT